MTNYQMALAGLRGCQAQLRAAHADARSALPHLTGARRARAAELAEKIADALAHCQRVIFVVTGDVRADEAQADA